MKIRLKRRRKRLLPAPLSSSFAAQSSRVVTTCVLPPRGAFASYPLTREASHPRPGRRGPGEVRGRRCAGVNCSWAWVVASAPSFYYYCDGERSGVTEWGAREGVRPAKEGWRRDEERQACEGVGERRKVGDEMRSEEFRCAGRRFPRGMSGPGVGLRSPSSSRQILTEMPGTLAMGGGKAEMPLRRVQGFGVRARGRGGGGGLWRQGRVLAEKTCSPRRGRVSARPRLSLKRDP